ncbi:MAG: hypothetical protein JXB62_00085 [Pirellulales bacterium]|nr:hypothetical protein [Pirellulales bacterium]
MSNALPRPSRMLVAVSVIVIAANLFLLSIYAGAIVVLDPCTIIGFAIVVPLWVAIALEQYLGTFRRVPSAAAATGVLLYLVGGLATFAFVTTVGETIVEGTALRLIPKMVVWILGPMLLIAAGSILAGRMNALWARKLRAAINSLATPPGPSRFRFSLHELLVGVGVAATMMGTASWYARSLKPPYAEHIAAADAPFSLPANATDVCYRQGARGTVTFECTTDEVAFRKWVDSRIGSIESQSAGVPLKEIVTPFIMTRYTGYPDTITVSHGLYYSWSKEDRAVDAVFDRTTNRAYYSAQWH